MDVFKNSGTPNHPFKQWYSLRNHPIWGPTPIFGNTRIHCLGCSPTFGNRSPARRIHLENSCYCWMVQKLLLTSWGRDDIPRYFFIGFQKHSYISWCRMGFLNHQQVLVGGFFLASNQGIPLWTKPRWDEWIRVQRVQSYHGYLVGTHPVGNLGMVSTPTGVAEVVGSGNTLCLKGEIFLSTQFFGLI